MVSASISVYPNGWLGTRLASDISGYVSDWQGNNTLQTILVTDTYAPNTSTDGHNQYDDVSGDEVSNSSYPGAQTMPVDLQGATKTGEGQGIYLQDGATDTSATFSNCSFSFRYAVLVSDRTNDGLDTSDDLVALLDPGQQLSPSSQDVNVTVTNGIVANFSY